MIRKLPPDSEVWALHASGLTYVQIAYRYGCGVGQVQKAIDLWNDKPITHSKLIKATTDDTDFVRAGKQPVGHRDTGNQIAGLALSEGIYAAQYLDIHECSDLLREWGVA